MRNWCGKQFHHIEDHWFTFHACLKAVSFEVITLQVNPISSALIGFRFWANLGGDGKNKMTGSRGERPVRKCLLCLISQLAAACEAYRL